MLDCTNAVLQLWIPLEDFLLARITSQELESSQVLRSSLSLLKQLDGIMDTTKVVKMAMGDEDTVKSHLAVLGQVVVEVMEEFLVALRQVSRID